MNTELTKAMGKFYHDLSIFELKLQNSLQDETKLTYNDLLYLDIISAHQGEYTSTQIADMLHVSRPSVTKKIKELIKKGYVTRKQCDNDKRVYYLFVNESIYFNYSGEKFGKELSQRIDGKYSNEEIHNLCELLNLIGDMVSREAIHENNE
ncbi:MAG: MarR family transcriptional regulator [Lachnospiraceae bacterium]